MKVFKVVKKVDDQYISIGCDNEPDFLTVYRVGETAYPPKKYPNAWLWAFKDFDRAFKFAFTFAELGTIDEHYLIFEAEASEIKDAEYMCMGGLDNPFSKFWKNKRKKGAKFIAWSNSLLCKDITLITEVYDGKVPF